MEEMVCKDVNHQPKISQIYSLRQIFKTYQLTEQNTL